jgi:hypothetical protein
MRKNRKSAPLSTTTTTAPQSAASDVPPTDGSTQDFAQVLALIDQIRALIPGFLPYDKKEARRVGGVARFAKDLIPEIIDTVTAVPPAGGVNTFDVVEGKASIDFDIAMKQVVNRLSSLLDGVQFTSDSRLARSARRALSTYAWAQNHAKGDESVELRPYLDQMSQTMKRVLGRRKKAAAPSTPPPTPAPTGAQGFLSPNLAAAKPAVDDDDDLPADFRKQLEEAVKD